MGWRKERVFSDATKNCRIEQDLGIGPGPSRYLCAMRGFYLVLTASTVGCAALSGREGLIDERRISSFVPRGILIINITMIPVHGDNSHGLRYSFRRESILGWLASQP
jgi:hypothetical protein